MQGINIISTTCYPLGYGSTITVSTYPEFMLAVRVADVLKLRSADTDRTASEIGHTAFRSRVLGQ
jgi:hypothetical protein